jgi:homoserine dehydrogenase
MQTKRLVLVGFGNVGKALVRLLEQKRGLLNSEYGVDLIFTGIYTAHHGAAIHPEGLGALRAIEIADAGGNLNELSQYPAFFASGLDFIQACPGDVLFENSPVNHHTGQPALDHLQAALRKKMDAITANKGPVVHGYQLLSQLAKENKRHFFFESAVMDGAPIFSLFRSALPGIELRGFHGILNSCTNMLLTQMEKGDTFEQALDYGRKIGITETDPSADVDGWDAAIKVAAISTVLMGVPLLPDQVDRQGIRGLTPADLAEARAQGKRWKLVCSARRDGAGVVARVAPEMVSPDSPLYSINGTSSYAQFETDTLPGLGIVESNPGPETTAYGLFADFLNTLR